MQKQIPSYKVNRLETGKVTEICAENRQNASPPHQWHLGLNYGGGGVHTAVYRIPELYPLDANSTLAPCGITTKYVSKHRQMSQGIRGMWHRKSSNVLTTNQHSKSMKRYVYLYIYIYRLNLEKFLEVYQSWASQFVILANENTTFTTIVQTRSKAKQTNTFDWQAP